MSGELVLVVDDNPQNLKLAKVLLVTEGYEVREAQNADDAMASLAAQRPSLILMDIQLPGVDGLELTKRLRADLRYREISIVAVTAYAMKGDRERVLAAGCDGYIAKPIDTESFPTYIESILRNGPPRVD